MLNKNFKTIFITGGAGFIGSHLADVLVQEKRKVTVFDNLSTGKKHFLSGCIKSKNFKFIKGDLLNKKLLSKSLPKETDVVFHLAANADVSKGFSNPQIDIDNTTISTFNLLEVMKDRGVKNIVFLSGSGVYGDVGQKLISENYGPLLPQSMYGATKLSAEGLICAYSNLFNFRSWILRPANIIGPRATHGVIFDFINKLKTDPSNLQILGDGLQSKSYVYVTDLLKAIMLVTKTNKKGIEIYNVSSDSFISVNSIANSIIKLMGLKKVRIERAKSKFGWPGDVPVIRLNTSNLKSTGWKAKYSSKAAVEKTVLDLIS